MGLKFCIMRKSGGTAFLAGAFVGLLLPLFAAAQEAQVGSGSSTPAKMPEVKESESVKAAATQDKHDDSKPQPNADSAEKYSAGVDEVLKMMQAGVTTDVIKTYIENAPIAYTLSANDIIALKGHAVPDELTTAMVKRGAALRALLNQARAPNAVPPTFSIHNNRPYNVFGPESYDYFQYYYLYPRTLADANQRFFAPSSSFSSFAPYGYGYGYYGPMPFQPLPPSAFQRQ